MRGLGAPIDPVRRRRWLVLGAVFAALLAAGATTAAVFPGPAGEADLGTYFFGPGMARAEVVMVIGGTVHDFRIDQGRIKSVRPGAVELYERDGTSNVIPLAPNARVLVNGVLAGPLALRRGMLAVAVRDGDGPATILRAEVRIR
jgi:hypothetical protein